MYNEEDTILNNNQGNNNYYEDESTILNEQAQEEIDETDAADKKKKKNETLKNVAINAGTGFAVGTLAAALMSAYPSPDSNGDQETPETPDTPVTTDGTLPVAHSVNDSMSFGQAFRAAHDEVGPGGVFEWHGQLYNTYTREEWNGMSHAQRQEFASHLKVVGHPDYESNVHHHNTHNNHHDHAADHQDHQDRHDHADHHDQAGHDQAIHEHHAQSAPPQDHGHDTAETQTVEVVDHEEPVVEVLGVEHVTMDDGSTAAVGGAVIDGNQIVVIDVDNDGMGDIMAADLNGDGNVDDSEIADISSDPIAMSEFETGGIDDTGADIDYIG